MAPLTRWLSDDTSRQSGRSSGVEHNLAKVGVVGSNPIARSSFPVPTNPRAFLCFAASGFAFGSNLFARPRFSEAYSVIVLATPRLR
jgi:hypothetical protein